MIKQQHSLETAPDSVLLRQINNKSPLNFIPEKGKQDSDIAPLTPMEVVEAMVAGNFKMNVFSEQIGEVRFLQQLNEERPLLRDATIGEYAETLWKNHQRTFDDFFDAKKKDLELLKRQIPAIKCREAQNDWAQNFKRLINPDFIAMDLNIMWSFINFEQEYEMFLDRLITNGLIKTKIPYQLDTNLVDHTYHLLNQRVINLAVKTKNYRGTYQQWLPSIVELSKIANGDFHEKATILINDLRAWHDVLETIEAEQTRLQQFMTSVYRWMYTRFTNILTENMKLQRKVLQTLSLKVVKVQFSYDRDELVVVTEELKSLFNKIETMLLHKEWESATTMLQNVTPVLHSSQQLQELQLRGGNSASYMEQLFTFASKVGGILDKPSVQFVQEAKGLIASQNTVLLRDKDLVQLGLPSKFDLAIQLIHFAIITGDEKKLLFVFDDLISLIERYENGEILGEERLSVEDDFFILLVLASQFLREKYEHPFITICNHNDLSQETIKMVVNKYKKIVGNDAFSRYFTRSVFGKVGQEVFQSVVNAIPLRK